MKKPISKRQIFYVHGFDQRGSRFYNLWQKREARVYSRRFGREIHVGDPDNDSWLIKSGDVETEFSFLDWTPVIKRRFGINAASWLISMISLWFTAIRQGLFLKTRRADWWIGLLMIWAFLPVFILCTILIASVFMGVLWGLGALCLFGAMVFVMWKFDRKLGIFYASNIAWAARELALKRDLELEALKIEFQGKLAGAQADEIILVGHSLGCALGMELLSQAPKHVKFLSVGQSIPLVSFQKEATQLQLTMDSLKEQNRIWIDVSAGRDVLGFSGFDPSQGEAQCYSAEFQKSHGTEVLQSLRWRGFDMHFLYFQSVTAQGSAWDWFDVLAGSMPLEDRFRSKAEMNGRGQRRMHF